jgi:ribonuclease P protein component
MLPPLHRLRTTKDVQLAMRGRTFHSPHFIIKFLPASKRVGADPQLVRLTVVVSTKVAKRAVVRNRIKRRARAILYQSLPGYQPGDYVVIAKSSAVKALPAELRASLVAGMSRR